MTIQKNELTIQQIRELAKSASEDLGGLQPGYNRAAVERVESFIERERVDLNKEARVLLTNRLGAFLGECILEAIEADWQWYEPLHTWGILSRSGLWIFPFSKVHKQLTEGRNAGESILNFFDTAIAYAPSGKLP
jgi:hypothetical protein